MKSIVMKSIYAGLGLLGTGKETVEQIGRKIAKRANLSEKDGERIAKQLKAKSEKAIASIQKSMETEVARVVHALHAAADEYKGSSSGAKRKAKPAHKAKRPAQAKHKPASDATTH